MKIRNGFVSNSSSSSFILIKPATIPQFKSLEELPKDTKEALCLEEDWFNEQYTEEDKKDILEKINSNIKHILSSDETYYENLDHPEADVDDFEHILDTIFEPFSLTSISAGPNEGAYIVLKRKDILRKLKETE